MRTSWQRARFLPLAGRDTLDELVRVLGYPKFALTKDEIADLLAAFLPYVEVVTGPRARGRALPPCRDPDGVKFLALAKDGRAGVLVTGDAALLELAPQVPFAIERPADFLERLGGDPTAV